MKIEKEYSTWVSTSKMLNLAKRFSNNWFENYKLNKVLGTFLLRCANRAPEGEVYIDVSMDDEIYQNLIREIVEQKFLEEYRARKVAEGIHRIIHKHFENLTKTYPPSKPYMKGNVVGYKKFKFVLEPERIEVLKKYPLNDVVGMIIRYACILQTGHQWALPSKWYSRVIKLFDASIEGFSSPLNSRIMLFKPEGKFCSVFPDTDNIFGSIGNIFDMTPDMIKDKTIIANPPYIIEIMNNFINQVNDWLDKVPARFISCVVAWEDAEYYNVAMNSPYLKYTECLEKQKHFYETSAKGKKKIIKSNFNSRIFVFSSMDDSPEISDLYKSITKYWRI